MSTYGHLWNLVAFETQRVSVAALVPSCFSHIFSKTLITCTCLKTLLNAWLSWYGSVSQNAFENDASFDAVALQHLIFIGVSVTCDVYISEHRVEIACTHLLALYFPSSTMLSLLYIRRHLVGGIVPQMFRTYISINSVSHWHRIFIFFICPLNKQFLTAKWIKVFFLTMRVYLINY